MTQLGSDEHTALNFAQLLSGPLIEFYVGPQRIHWIIHSNLLHCHGVSLEGLTRSGVGIYDLPEDDTRAFELLVNWLYRGELEVSVGEDPYESAVTYQKLYVLCERFGDGLVTLRNVVIDLYRRSLNLSLMVPDPDELGSIYHMAATGSPLRRLMVDIAARQVMDPEVERKAEEYEKVLALHPEFAFELINAVRVMSGGILLDDPTDSQDRNYHVHDMPGCLNRDSGLDDNDIHLDDQDIDKQCSAGALIGGPTRTEDSLLCQIAPAQGISMSQEHKHRAQPECEPYEGIYDHGSRPTLRMHERQRPQLVGRSTSLPAKTNGVLRIRVDEMIRRFDRLNRDRA